MTISRHNRVYIVMITAFFFLFLGLATFRLTENPPVWYDEGLYGQLVYNLRDTGQFGIRVSPSTLASARDQTGGFPLIAPAALIMNVTGNSLIGIRIAAIMFLVLLFSSTLLFSVYMWGWATSVLVILFIFSFPSIFGGGKSFLGEIPGLFYLVSTLVALYIAEKKNWHVRSRQYGLLGLLAGLCVATKPIFILFAAALFLVIFIGRKEISVKNLAVLLTSFAVPVLVWMITQFGPHDSIIGILTFYVNPYGLSNQVVNPTGVASGVALFAHNFLRFFTETTPIFFMLMFLIWCGSGALRYHKQQTITKTELAAFIFVFFIGLAYMRTPGYYRYLLPGLVINMLFFTQNMHVIVVFLASRLSRYADYSSRVTCAIILLLSLWNIKLLYRGSFITWSYNSHKSSEITKYMNTLPDQASILVYNAPEIVLFIPNSKQYYQYFSPADENAMVLGKENIKLIQDDALDVIIMHAEGEKDNPKLFASYPYTTKFGEYIALSKTTALP